jgi:hypothetical protein
VLTLSEGCFDGDFDADAQFNSVDIGRPKNCNVFILAEWCVQQVRTSAVVA